MRLWGWSCATSGVLACEWGAGGGGGVVFGAMGLKPAGRGGLRHQQGAL